ncbi:hypothetical protein [Mesorhizobium sp. M0340]|uniref:hypothetical protein n=1 Tax=unclassified Mesorhizobium TaxID=325217 RepID=UPI0033380334
MSEDKFGGLWLVRGRNISSRGKRRAPARLVLQVGASPRFVNTNGRHWHDCEVVTLIAMVTASPMPTFQEGNSFFRTSASVADQQRLAAFIPIARQNCI